VLAKRDSFITSGHQTRRMPLAAELSETARKLAEVQPVASKHH